MKSFDTAVSVSWYELLLKEEEFQREVLQSTDSEERLGLLLNFRRPADTTLLSCGLTLRLKVHPRDDLPEVPDDMTVHVQRIMPPESRDHKGAKAVTQVMPNGTVPGRGESRETQLTTPQQMRGAALLAVAPPHESRMAFYTSTQGHPSSSPESVAAVIDDALYDATSTAAAQWETTEATGTIFGRPLQYIVDEVSRRSMEGYTDSTLTLQPILFLCTTLCDLAGAYDAATHTVGSSLDTILDLPPSSLPVQCHQLCRRYTEAHRLGALVDALRECHLSARTKANLREVDNRLRVAGGCCAGSCLGVADSVIKGFPCRANGQPRTGPVSAHAHTHVVVPTVLEILARRAISGIPSRQRRPSCGGGSEARPLPRNGSRTASSPAKASVRVMLCDRSSADGDRPHPWTRAATRADVYDALPTAISAFTPPGAPATAHRGGRRNVPRFYTGGAQRPPRLDDPIDRLLGLE